jgi:hypothetical protein
MDTAGETRSRLPAVDRVRRSHSFPLYVAERIV